MNLYLWVNIYLFIGFYFCYSLVSTYWLAVTAAGWSGLLWISLLLIYYSLPLPIFLIQILFSLITWNFQVRVLFRLRLFFLSVVFQLIAILTNTGDCGDSQCSSIPVFFIDRFLKNTQYYMDQDFRNSWALIGIIIKLFYFILFYVFLLRTFLSTNFNKKI